MRMLIVRAMERVPGIRCGQVGDGMGALRELVENDYDLVITDINMPVMDGVALVRFIRSDETLAAVPIIVVTAEGADEERENALASGADAYLTKPIDARRLVELVTSLVKPARGGEA